MTECTQDSFEFEAHISRQVTASFDGGTLTTDGGALLLRQADKRIDLLKRLAGCFTDCRKADRVEHPLGEMLAQRIYGLALGYEDLNDHEQLRHDPLMAVLAGKKKIGQQLAGKSALNRLELSPAGDAQKERYSKISYSAEAIDELLVMVFQESDPQTIEDTNLNRLVGGTEADVKVEAAKVSIAERLIRHVNSKAEVQALQTPWQSQVHLLCDCDVILSCVDSCREREELERTARRFLIPYIDVGMDVHSFGGEFLITGQLAASLPGQPCLWCMGLLTEELLAREAQAYGAAGSRPQVIWPNGVLASSAVGLFMSLVTPWQTRRPLPLLLEYDGNAHTVVLSNKLSVLSHTLCIHHPTRDLGDPFFTIT